MIDQTPTDYVLADASGRISLTGRIPNFMIAGQPVPAGSEIVLGSGAGGTHYVSSHELLERPASTVALDGMTLKSLPVPCTITIDGTDHACEDDHCELSFSHPGTYNVTVSAWPMLDATFEVTQA